MGGRICGNPYYSPVLYFLGQRISGLLFDTLWRRKVKGRVHIPPFGEGVIFAANHRSLADPNLVGSAVPYPIHYFAKEELFRIPVVGWYIRRVNSIPVRRAEQDIGAFKNAQRVLQLGEALVLFPEGGRRLDHRQWKAKSGVGMLAGKTQVRVVPVFIKNSENFARLGRIEVIFGAPLNPPREESREAYQAFSDLVMTRIRELGS